MYAVGVATSNTNKGFKNYVKSARKHKMCISIIGMGCEWGGWKWRTDQYIKELEFMCPEDLVVITDVYDVVFTAGEQEIKSIYMKLTGGSRKVVFGMEDVCRANCSGNVTDKGTLKYVNAGACVGRVREVLIVWKSIREHYEVFDTVDDQFVLSKLLIENSSIRNMITLDTESLLICNVTATQSFKGYNTVDGVPILHFPGPMMWPSKVNTFNRSVRTFEGEEIVFQMQWVIVGILLLSLCTLSAGKLYINRTQ